MMADENVSSARRPADAGLECMRLWSAHQAEVYAYVLAAVRGWSDADDVLQETAAAVWQSFADFRPGSDFRRWALTIAHHRVLRFRREKARAPLADLSALEAIAVAAEEPMSDRRRALEGCVEKLPASDRSLLGSYFEAGGKVAKVATAIGRGPRSVSQSLYRIRLALHECVDRQLRLEGPS